MKQGAFLKAGIRGMVDLENEEGDEFGKEPPRGPRQLCAKLGQTEFAFEVPSQAQADQQVVQHFERREFVFIDNLAVAEHLARTSSRPVEMLDRPMDEDALERFRLGQSDGPVFLCILKRQQGRAQQWRLRKIGMVIGKGSELDHRTMLPQAISRGQTKSALIIHDRLVKR